MTDVEYHSNNSGGHWWLSDNDWKNLESAGWEVDWEGTERFLGALATRATKKDTSMKEAIEEWESITGKFSNELGCGCCGPPHNFSSSDGEYYSPNAPVYGDRY